MINLHTIKTYYKYFKLIVFSVFLQFSCKKSSSVIPFEVINSPVSNNINKSFWFNASEGFICGGTKNDAGFIYSTKNGGKTWDRSLISDGISLYDIYFFNDTLGYCCGDNVSLYKTINKGQSWTKVDLTTHYDDFYKCTLRKIVPGNNSFIIVGGQFYSLGLIIGFQNQIIRPGFMGTSNELRSAFAFNDTNFVCCGYGTAYQSKNNLSTYTPIKIADDFITDCIALTPSNGYACGYNGGIYKITKAGNNIEKLKDYNRNYKARENYTGMYFKNESEGWIIGNKGALLHTVNGKDFKELNTSQTSNFLSIVSNKNNELIISTSEGKLIKITP